VISHPNDFDVVTGPAISWRPLPEPVPAREPTPRPALPDGAAMGRSPYLPANAESGST